MARGFRHRAAPRHRSNRSRADRMAVECAPPLFDPPSNELILCLSAGLLAHGQCPRSSSRNRSAAFSDVFDRGRSAYSCGGSSGLDDLSPDRIPVSPLARHRRTGAREHDARLRASSDRMTGHREMPGASRRSLPGPAVDNAVRLPMSSSISFGERGTRAEHHRPNAIMSEAASQGLDVLVVGGGSAALCAAIAARRRGASVRLVEQAPASLRGGNTRHARNFRLMHDRPEWYVPDAYGEDAFFKDLVRVTHGATDEPLARLMIRGSATIAQWLDGNGVRLQNPGSGAMPYSQPPAFFLGGGKAMINALYATAAKLGVRIGYDSEVVALAFGDGRDCEADIVHGGRIERIASKTMVLCSVGHQADLAWLRESFGAAAGGFMIRGTRYVTGSVLRLLLDAGARPVGDPSRAHMVAVDARGPKFDGGIVTRITAIPHGIVVDRDGKRFHDEGEDARKTHFARWGARIADRPGQIAYLILDAQGVGRALPTVLPPIRADTIASLASALGVGPAAPGTA